MTGLLIAYGLGIVTGVVGYVAVPWCIKKFQGLLK